MLEFIDMGIAGVLVLTLAWFVRHLVGQMRDDRKYMEDRMDKLLSTYHEDCERRDETEREHTQVLMELKTWLKAKNGH